MARKAVLEGGKRDEIIAAAAELFFEKGYEATSVRMITDRVGGEIGMFYHYFKSKDMLFDAVADRFFRDFQRRFEALAEGCASPEEFTERFIELYDSSMEQYALIGSRMHWTIQCAMHQRTLSAMVPAVVAVIERWGIKSTVPADILAAQLIGGISAAIHSESCKRMDKEQKKEMLDCYIRKLILY